MSAAPKPDNPDAGTRAMTEFWRAAGDAALQAQEDAAQAFSGAFAGFFAPPATASRPAAEKPAGATPDWNIGSFDTLPLARAGQAMSELMLSASALFEKLFTAVMAAAQAGTTHAEAGFRAMIEPNAWLTGAMGFEAMQGPAAYLAEGPKFADLWTVERRQARVFKAWLDMHRCRLEHGAVVLKAWLKAGQVFLGDLGTRTQADGRAPIGRTLLALWTEVANRELLETQRSEPFLRTQAALMRTSTELKLAQREVVEAWADQFDLPTRTELDDVHRSVTALRRELRLLQRERRNHTMPAVAATPPQPEQVPKPAAAVREVPVRAAPMRPSTTRAATTRPPKPTRVAKRPKANGRAHPPGHRSEGA
nr:poly(R)-hydroxyalkanoic acid synthase subunit PhaE [uncultured Lichenicoccus sp.]